MLHLIGAPVEKHVLQEIGEYEKRLTKIVKNDESLAKAVDRYTLYEEGQEHIEEDYPVHYPGHTPISLSVHVLFYSISSRNIREK